MNKPLRGNDLKKVIEFKDPEYIDTLINDHDFGGGTLIGTAFKDTILDTFMFKRRNHS